MTHKKKFIEVALPLEAINKASVREKSLRHGPFRLLDRIGSVGADNEQEVLSR